MAKLAYNETLVNESLSLLKRAESEISNTGASVVSALSTVAGARGANYLDMSAMLGAGGLNESCIQLIEETITGINARVEMIEEYNEDYENAGFFKKLFSTGRLLGTKAFEGLFGAGEQIVDGFASAAGFLVGIVNKDAKEAIGEFVKKDHVGDYYESLYNGELSDTVKYSFVKEDGFFANAAKIIGTSAGYTAALALGGGIYGAATKVAGTAASSATLFQSSVTGAKVLMGSVKAAATMAGIGGMGSGTQAAMQSGKTFDEALLTGVKTAAIQAGTVLVVDWGIKKIAKAWSNFKTKRAGGAADDIAGVADDAVGKGTGAADDIAGGADDAAAGASGNNPKGPTNNPSGGAAGAADDLGKGTGAASSADDIGRGTGGAANSADDIGRGAGNTNSGTGTNTGKGTGAASSADDAAGAAGRNSNGGQQGSSSSSSSSAITSSIFLFECMISNNSAFFFSHFVSSSIYSA